MKKTQKSDEKFFYNARMLFSCCKTDVFFTAMQLPISPISDNCRMRVYLSPSRACSVRAACAPSTGILHFLLSQVSHRILRSSNNLLISSYLYCHSAIIHQNKPLFSLKQHVIFNKTTRRFHQNNTSFSLKHHVDERESSATYFLHNQTTFSRLYP